MVGSARRRGAALLAAVTAAAGLGVATAPPAAAAESYVVSYPEPAVYFVDGSAELTVGVTDFDPLLGLTRTVAVRATYPDGQTVDREVTLTAIAPTATVAFATQRRASLTYSVTFYDGDDDFLHQELFGVEVVGRPTVLTTIWPTQARVRERAPYVVHGRVSGSPRTLIVQRRATGTWMTLGTGRSRADGSYAVRLDTRWVTTHRDLRVVVPEIRTHDAIARAKSGALTVTRSYRPRPGLAWKPIRGDGFPGQRWSPCGTPRQTLTYRLNPDRAPRGHLTEIKRALAQVTAATGFAFKYAGTTSVVPLKRGTRVITRNADLTIAYANQRLVPVLRGGVIGVAPVASQYAGTSWWRVVAAGVVLDTQPRLAPGFGGGKATRGSVLIHELGHVMGLAHVDDRRQVMYPAITTQEARYASGDLLGLSNLGIGRGCFPADANPYPRAGADTGTGDTARRLPGPTRTVVHRVRR